MSAHEPSFPAASLPLAAHVAELRGRCQAVARLQGGSTYFQEELGIFRDYAEERGYLLDAAPEALSRPPDDEGNEHQIWFEPAIGTYLKATWPGFFGLLVIYRPAEERKASPVGYLERWHLHVELFGDEVSFLGALPTAEGLRLLIRQRAIAGTPATEDQIDAFFTGSGWQRFTVANEVAYFDPGRQVVISDTHRGNLILMDDGLLAPIDLRVQPLDSTLLDIVHQLCA